MFYIKDSYATVFETEDKGKYVKANISTSRKDQDGKYVNSYWKAMFFGKCVDAAKELSDKSRIHITSGNVSNESYTDSEGNKKYFTAVKIFEFEKLGGSGESGATDSGDSDSGKKSKKSKTKTKAKTEEFEDDDVPF